MNERRTNEGMNELTNERAKKDESSPSEGNYSEKPNGCYIMVMHRSGSKPLCCGSPWER